MKNVETEFASRLLEVQAVKVQPDAPFTWASGWKSPFYCDNRKTLSYPELRTFVKDNLVVLVKEFFAGADAVAGVAKLPFCYVRSKAKDHGMGNLIEGTLPEGSKVVVVEDLISTGGSSLKAVEALRAAGFEVVGMVAAYTYGFPVAEAAFREAGVKLVTLTNYEAVVKVATETGYITREQQPTLDEWRKDPANWKK